jgi:AraC family transcriptional regulator, regulatory protein of adaptative response / methylated-DNA-[protein]-cysteine methyltransferase
MLQDIASMDLDHEPPSADYDRVRTAIAFISREWRRQPSLDEIAGEVGISASHLHAVFRRWSGLSPKAFLQAVTLDHARRLLKSDAPLLDASLELGLSGPGRLHDLFVTHEAMSPGEWKTGGVGLTLSYGFHPSPFGEALAVVTEHGLAGIGFVDDTSLTGPAVERAFTPDLWRKGQPLKIVMIGSDFEIRVWRALLSIPFGRLTTYGDLAQTIGQPKAARAVGAAVGRNPISFVVPCHRVIGKSGTLTGYHWGLSRKQAILGWEACQLVGA